MPAEQFNAPTSQERQATRFESGDQLDLHMASEHVKPYEEPKKPEVVANAERNSATPEFMSQKDQVALIGKYVMALRTGKLDLAA